MEVSEQFRAYFASWLTPPSPDIHPGNVALPPPPRRHIEQYLATRQPPVHQVRRKDGTPTHPNLPRQVTEPVDIGFGEGNTNILDFGYAFRAIEGGSYKRAQFPRGTPLPPELLGAGTTTTLPFKVDSWHLGLCVGYRRPLFAALPFTDD